jgi:16S rRNA (guanine(1405)-N(7))-methyltransferase
MNDERIRHSVDDILASKKYRDLHIPPETVISLLIAEFERFGKIKPAVKSTKQKLHNIVAAYLGDPDYEQAINWMNTSLPQSSPQEEQTMCEQLLSTHASTRERLPHLCEFYKTVFAVTGKPSVILDLACGLHPLGLPWMGLPATIEYHAYDLHLPRIELIQAYFSHRYPKLQAHHQDILFDIPTLSADVAFLFKETHRIEKRAKDSNVPLWQQLNVNWLVISLPAFSLNQQHDLREGHRNLVNNLLEKTSIPWQQTVTEVHGEMLFMLQKS